MVVSYQTALRQKQGLHIYIRTWKSSSYNFLHLTSTAVTILCACNLVENNVERRVEFRDQNRHFRELNHVFWAITIMLFQALLSSYYGVLVQNMDRNVFQGWHYVKRRILSNFLLLYILTKHNFKCLCRRYPGRCQSFACTICTGILVAIQRKWGKSIFGLQNVLYIQGF